jgi:RNA polymerase sigma factor (sigma-70 family)
MPSHPTPERISLHSTRFPSTTPETCSQLDLLQRYATARLRLAELQKSSATPPSELSRWESEALTARNQLIVENRGLVASMIQPYRNLGLETADLIQEGLIGLIKGIENFDPQRGCQLSTFAGYWIRQSITRALSKQSRTIRIPEERLTEIRLVKSTAELLEKTMGCVPSTEEIAREMGKPASRIKTLLQNAQAPLSIDAPIGDEDESPIHELLEDSSHEHPAQSIDHTTFLHWLKEGCSTLTEREYRVIELKFGVGQQAPMTLETIGGMLDLSRQRVSQIVETATEKLRTFFAEKETPKTKVRPVNKGPRSTPRPIVTASTSPIKKQPGQPISHPPGLRIMQPPISGTLAIRSVAHKLNHHLWNNNGTWFCKFRVRAPGGSVQRINQSLQTKCIEDARLRRDALMQGFQNPIGHAA